MASELEGLLDAIRERPDDDLPRLALADWCMEQPDAILQARGEFIQLRCQAAALPTNSPQRGPIEQRARALRIQHEKEWLGAIVKNADAWDFDRGLVVIELRSNFHRRLSLDWLVKRPDWFWVIGVKGVLLERSDVRRLTTSAGAEQLTTLDLSDCEIGPAGAELIASSKRLGRLASLRLNYSRIADEGADALAQSSGLPRLTVLSLFASGIGPKGVQALANALGLSRLAVLDLGNNALRQEGARAITNCAALGALTALLLSGCQLGDRGAWSLVHATSLEKLQLLDVTNNRIGIVAREALTERFGTRVRMEEED